MLDKKEIRSSTNEKLLGYINTEVKPQIKSWQDERKRISAVIRNREMQERKKSNT
jgi:hypothetical protein